MKILIDQNISHRLVAQILNFFPEIEHVKTLNLINAKDTEIFTFARQNNFSAILTLDEDFYKILFQFGQPPKIIWLRIGNVSTKNLSEIMIKNAHNIQQFLADTQHDCLEIYA